MSMEMHGMEAHKPATRAESAPSLSKAHARAERELKSPIYAISPKEFERAYGKEEVARDMAKAEQLRTQYDSELTPEARETKMLATVLEAIILTEGEESKWFGENARLFRTTDHDDMVNHTDMVAEWTERNNEKHLLALAVDVTFGEKAVEKKLKRIKEQVDRGQLGKLKYVHGAHAGTPRAVIGMSRDAVKELSELWMDEDYEALREHPVQRALLEEIYIQLSSIADYAEQKREHHIAAAYRKSLPVISSLLLKKRDIDREGSFRQDAVFQAISKETAVLFGKKRV